MIGATQESSVNIWLVSGGGKTARTMSREKTISRKEVETMRIISQNGKINLPYEMTALLVSDNYIQAVFAGGIQQSPYVMAMYSTQDKLQDALDMLDRRFVGMGDAIFRFPKDDKV